MKPHLSYEGVLRIALRDLYLLGKHSTNELHLAPWFDESRSHSVAQTGLELAM
jgi:hypothetical protein